MKIITCHVLFALVVLATGTLALADEQDQAATSSVKTDVKPAGVADTAQLQPKASTAAMLPTTTAKSLAVTDTQPAITAYTGMAPGICLVVDEVVRQFCAANPDDISCQFQ